MNSDIITVLIAIQARSTSKRFPQKIFQNIGNKSVLQRVIDVACGAKKHIERPSNKYKIKCIVVGLIPKDDEQLKSYIINSRAVQKNNCEHVVLGDEENVFSRYSAAQAQFNPDYIVRITSDCPLLQDIIISKHINVAVINGVDYASNVDEKFRLIADGLDCEIISKKAMRWLEENNKTPHDLEHVTTAIRRVMPTKELRMAAIIPRIDTSNLKMSLDTPEDLDRMRSYHHILDFKQNEARRIYGSRNVFEL